MFSKLVLQHKLKIFTIAIQKTYKESKWNIIIKNKKTYLESGRIEPGTAEKKSEGASALSTRPI